MGAAAADVHGEFKLSVARRNPLPLWERVAKSNEVRLSRVRGLSPRTRTLTRPRFARAPSPTRGEGKEAARVSSNPRHHHVFDLDIFFHAVMRAFAAEATFLDAAERRDFRRDQA